MSSSGRDGIPDNLPSFKAETNEVSLNDQSSSLTKNRVSYKSSFVSCIGTGTWNTGTRGASTLNK